MTLDKLRGPFSIRKPVRVMKIIYKKGAHCVCEKSVLTSTTQEVPTNILVLPMQISIRCAHGFRAHHLLNIFIELTSLNISSHDISPRVAYAVSLLSDPCLLNIRRSL